MQLALTPSIEVLANWVSGPLTEILCCDSGSRQALWRIAEEPDDSSSHILPFAMLQVTSEQSMQQNCRPGYESSVFMFTIVELQNRSDMHQSKKKNNSHESMGEACLAQPQP